MSREDNAAVAEVIRTVMPEFGAVGPGYSINDPEVDDMFGAYANPGHGYFVIEQGGTVYGGAGIGPLEPGDTRTCELRKMYLLQAARGSGNGRRLLDACLKLAAHMGYQRCYLETLALMDGARQLYRRAGFDFIDGPLGDTGHTKCDRYMLKELA